MYKSLYRTPDPVKKNKLRGIKEKMKQKEENKSKRGIIDKRIVELIEKFKEFRFENEISVTEAYLLVKMLDFVIKNEIDNEKQKSFFNGLGFDEVINKTLGSFGGALK